MTLMIHMISFILSYTYPLDASILTVIVSQYLHVLTIQIFLLIQFADMKIGLIFSLSVSGGYAEIFWGLLLLNVYLYEENPSTTNCRLFSLLRFLVVLF